jgi:lantibiotic modifying enzyme
VPFRAKVLASPAAYRRADAGVLYMARRDFPRARGLIAGIHSQLETGLRDGVPLFTKRLARGLGIAEDPGTELSFGEDRCKLVAQALLAAFRERTLDPGSKLATIEVTFRNRNLDARRPYLCAGSSDAYSLRSSMQASQPREPASQAVRSRTATTHDTARRTRHLTAAATLLTGAIAVGDALCATAYWDRSRRRCNWVGRSNNGTLLTGGNITPRTDALSWDLYGGLGGVALFLAALFMHTGTSSFRRTALGAIRCANEQLERDMTAHVPTAVSFYGGVTGAAYSTWRVGEQTEEQTLTGSLVEAVSAAASSSAKSSEAEDFLGCASAIGALTSLARHAHLPQCHDLALAIGRRLCRSELMTRYSAHQHHTGELALTGLAHGAAGIGLGLLELHADTGEDEFLNAARKAFAYEDRLFDAASGNWPDLRQPPPWGPASRPRFALAWCHGAPGIALSRLRASQIDTSRRSHYLEHAQAALDATRRELQRMRTIDGIDPTPCHGTAGLIETLLTGGLVLHDHAYEASARDAAVELALGVMSGNALRSGTVCGGPNPSLMLGTAGVGYQFLRVHTPHTVPSLLTVPTA